jgi:ATP synthase protein I
MGHVPLALAVSAGVLMLSALVGWLGGDAAGAAGAAAGVALVVVSYLVSSVVVAWADSVSPRLVLPFGLASYITKIVVLGLVMLAVVRTGWDGTAAMGLAIIAGVVGWTAANIWWAVHRPPGATNPTRTGSGQAAGGQE